MAANGRVVASAASAERTHCLCEASPSFKASRPCLHRIFPSRAQQRALEAPAFRARLALRCVVRQHCACGREGYFCIEIPGPKMALSVRQLSVFKEGASNRQRCRFRTFSARLRRGPQMSARRSSSRNFARRLAQLFAIDHHREVVLSKRAAEREHMRVADRANVEAE